MASVGFNVGFKIAGQSGPLWLDGGGALASHKADTPQDVKTDVTAPEPGADNVWTVKFAWSAMVGAATMKDLAANVDGPNMLKMILDSGTQTYKGVVHGLDDLTAPQWSIAAGGPITDLSSLPVCLSLKLPPSEGAPSAPCYLTPAASRPPAETPTVGQFSTFETAQRWLLQPFTDAVPPAAYTGLVVQGFTVQKMLVDIWNACVGTEWARTYAPSLIAWMYEYPKAWPAPVDPPNSVNAKWMNDVKTRLYDKVYGPYFVQNNTGFGSGDPPDGGPPPRMGGRPPHKPR